MYRQYITVSIVIVGISITTNYLSMPIFKPSLIAFFAALALAGCATPPPSPEHPKEPEIQGSPALSAASMPLLPIPMLYARGWNFVIRPSTGTSSPAEVGLSDEGSSINKASSMMPDQHGIDFILPSDVTAAHNVLNATSSAIQFFSQKSFLPAYSSYAQMSSLVIEMNSRKHDSACDAPFGTGYPFIMSSLRFEKSSPVTFGGVRFDHAEETMVSKEMPITRHYYQGTAHGLCYRIMKIVDRGGSIGLERAAGIERDFSDILQSLTLY